MTKDEAIKYGKEQLEIFGGKHADFIELAIELLEQDDNKKLLEIKQTTTKKEEIMKDLKFCQELMDRLVGFADKYYMNRESEWEEDNHTVVQNDIIRLRRELNEVRKKIEE